MAQSINGRSNLYMTTQEFADLVIEALDEQEYFKRDATAHPQDIAGAFSLVGDTIGEALTWAIRQEFKAQQEKLNDLPKKKAMMRTTNLSKIALPIDDEIAPITGIDLEALGCS